MKRTPALCPAKRGVGKDELSRGGASRFSASVVRGDIPGLAVRTLFDNKGKAEVDCFDFQMRQELHNKVLN